jgi:RimJ/RimL family protein N-acetyltransferase
MCCAPPNEKLQQADHLLLPMQTSTANANAPLAPRAAMLVRPKAEHLPAYCSALQRGYSPNTVRGAAAAQDELRQIERDAAAFLAVMDDPQAKGPAVTQLDGTQRPRLPGFVRWIWLGPDPASAPGQSCPADAAGRPGEGFAGSINLRWMFANGSANAPLPPYVSGHVGYSVVPWQQKQGLATWALGALLPLARAQGLSRIELTTHAENLASQRVIQANGGRLLERYARDASQGGGEGLRYEIALT